MNDTTNERAVIGGNVPPVSEGFTKIAERFAELQATCSAWLTKCPKIENQQQADDCAGFMKQIIALEKEAEAQRKADQAPHQKKIDAIRESFRPFTDGLARMKPLLEPKQRAWLKAEQDRIDREKRKAAEDAALAERRAREQREEAERLIARAEAGELQAGSENVMAKINAAAEAELEAEDRRREAEDAERQKAKAGGQHTTGGVKRSTTLRSTWSPTVVDLGKACAYFAKKGTAAQKATIAEAVLKATRDAMKAAGGRPEIPGIHYVETEKAV